MQQEQNAKRKTVYNADGNLAASAERDRGVFTRQIFQGKNLQFGQMFAYVDM